MRSDGLNWAPIARDTLNIGATLKSGQTFRWRRVDESEWVGPIGNLAVRLQPSDAGFGWQTYPKRDDWAALERYFALDVDLSQLTGFWAAREPGIRKALEQFAGLRVLRQGAEEAFFSFLCSSCNTIVKITRSIQALERRAGEPVAVIAGECIYRFPSAAAISALQESALREDLWGYRAPRVIELARHIAAQGTGYLERLRYVPYGDAHRGLSAMFGIGPKLADCTCLFGLGHNDAVPVDTHIRKMAIRLWRPDLAHKSMTPSVYAGIGDMFRERFGPFAGWAQQYLFMESLRP